MPSSRGNALLRLALYSASAAALGAAAHHSRSPVEAATLSVCCYNRFDCSSMGGEWYCTAYNASCIDMGYSAMCEYICGAPPGSC